MLKIKEMFEIRRRKCPICPSEGQPSPMNLWNNAPAARPHHLSHRSQREAGAILSGIRGTMGHFILLISNIL